MGAAAVAVSPVVVRAGAKESAARTAPGELGAAKTTLLLLLDHLLSVDFPRYNSCLFKKKKNVKSGLHPLAIAKVRFQHSTTKPYNIGHPIVKTGQIWPLGWF